MLRPLLGISAVALIFMAGIAQAQRPNRVRPPTNPPAQPSVQQPAAPTVNPQIQNPPIQRNPAMRWNQNWNQTRFWFDGPYVGRWNMPYPVYGGYTSIWYTPFGGWRVPVSGRLGWGGVFASGYFVPEVNAAIPIEARGHEYGLRITEVFAGGAKDANLRAGDVIVGVGDKRTQTFEELQLALLGNTQTDVVFINADNQKMERLPVKVESGKIGVAVMPVALQ
jgi:hypothetical protein